jgi:two-component system LytT family response regulator
MHALIVEDERRSREMLVRMLELYCANITSIAQAESVATAIASIDAQKPDILFLDIRLGDGSGFDVLRAKRELNLAVVFTTAYDNYAIQAIKTEAVDYLLKPIDPDDLVDAVERIDKQRKMEFKKTIDRLTLKTADNIHVVHVQDIIYCAADKSYTTFYLVGGEKIMVSKNLREYELALAGSDFLRVHQSYLVNLNQIVRYEKGDKNILILTENHEVSVSVRKKEQLMQFFNQIN